MGNVDIQPFRLLERRELESRLAFYGLALIVVMLVFPGSMQGGVGSLARWVRTHTGRENERAPTGFAGNNDDGLVES